MYIQQKKLEKNVGLHQKNMIPHVEGYWAAVKSEWIRFTYIILKESPKIKVQETYSL